MICHLPKIFYLDCNLLDINIKSFIFYSQLLGVRGKGMKKLVLFIILIVGAVSFTVPAWSKKDGDPPVIKTTGVFKANKVVFKKDGDPPVVKTGGGVLPSASSTQF